MAQTTVPPLTPFPTPPGKYEQHDESNFRRMVERMFVNLSQYVLATGEESYGSREDALSVGWLSGGTISGSVAPAKLAEDTFTDTEGTDLNSHTPDSGFGSWGPYAGLAKIRSNKHSYEFGLGRVNISTNNIVPTSDTAGLTLVSEITINASSTSTRLNLYPNSTGGGGSTYNIVGVYLQINQGLTDTVTIACGSAIGAGTNRPPLESQTSMQNLAWTWGTTKRVIFYVREVSGTLYADIAYEDTDGSNHSDLGTYTWDNTFGHEYYWGVGYRIVAIGGQAYSSLYHVTDNLVIYDGEYTGGTAGVNVTAGAGRLRDAASDSADIYDITWSASTDNTAPTDGNTKYVGVEWNGGSPQVSVRDTENWNYQTDFPLGYVYNNAGSLEITNDPLVAYISGGTVIDGNLVLSGDLTVVDITASGDLALTGTLDVGGIATFANTAQFDTDVTIDGNLYLPTMGLIAMGVGTAYGQISLDTGAGIGITSPESVTVDIDANNDETATFFKVRKNLTTDVLRVQENGDLYIARSVYIGESGSGTLVSATTTGNKINLDSSMGGSDHSVSMSSTDEVRIYLDTDEDTTTADFAVYHGSGFGTLVFNVKENGQVDVPTGPFIVGTDPTGDELVRVGGTVRIENWDLTHASGYDEGFVVSGTHSVASTGGPVGAGFYLGLTHATGNVAEFYGVDIGAYVDATGNTVTWGTALELWAGTDGGAITDLDVLYITSPWGTITNATGLKIADITAGSSTNYAIETGEGEVRFGDDTVVVDPGGAIGDESNITFTGGRAQFGYYGTNSAARVYGSSGKGVEFWSDATRRAYFTSAGKFVYESTEFVIGTDPGGGALLRVGGDVRVSGQTVIQEADTPVLYLSGTGTTGATIIFRTLTGADSTSRHRISIQDQTQFWMHGDDHTTQNFIFSANYLGTRTYSAVLHVVGAGSGWTSPELTLTHDGSDGIIATDVGNLYLQPAGHVLPGTGGTCNLGSQTLYYNDVYAERFRAANYFYAYPWATGTGGSYLYLDGYAGTPTIYTRASKGTYSSKTVIEAYNSLGVWAGQGWDGTNWFTGASITMLTGGNNWSGTDHGSNIYFATTADASTTLTTRWRVHGAGSFMPYTDDAYDLGHTSYRIQAIHATGLRATGSYTIVNPTGGTETLPTNMTAGLVVRRDGGTLPTVNSANVAVFSSNSAAGTNAIVNIIAGTTGTGQLLFGDSGAYHRGGISYDHSAAELKFSAGSNYYVALKSGGNLLLRDDALSELATTATAGFVHIPTCNGAPTGTPTTYTGTLPLVYDRSNNHLMVYNGAWETFHSSVQGYDEMTTPVGTTSATLEDVTGASITVTLPTAKDVLVYATFEIETQSGASPSTLGLAINGDGTDGTEVSRYLSGSSDRGLGSVMAQFTGVAAGSRTFKLRFRRVSGSATPGINVAQMYVEAV